MISLTVAEIAAAIGAEAPAGTAEQVVGGSVETDSRLVGAGSICEFDLSSILVRS